MFSNSLQRPFSRRDFLRAGSAAAAGVVLSGCARPGGSTFGAPSPRLRRLAPVNVRADRVIRAVAGLRPYRPSGFVVRADRFGERTVVHNYGHGGGGISLAWGSSELAVELATAVAHERDFRRFAVLGCGILGLTTARLLQDRGFEVTIHTRDLPPHTTSNIGGGQWSPSTVFQTGMTSAAFDAQYERAARLSHARYQTMAGPRYGVRWIENYVLRSGPGPLRSGPLSDLYPQGQEFGPGEHPFHTPWVGRFTTMLIEPNTFLPAVMQDFLLRGGEVRVGEFGSVEEVLALEEPGIVNCTGLGSSALFGDRELVPIRGQLVVLLPQPEVDYIALGGGGYMFPREDGIILGGSQERGEWVEETTPEVVERILAANQATFQGMV